MRYACKFRCARPSSRFGWAAPDHRHRQSQRRLKRQSLGSGDHKGHPKASQFSEKTFTEQPLPARHCAREGQNNKQDGPLPTEVSRQGPTNKQPAHNVMSVIIRGCGKKTHGPTDDRGIMNHAEWGESRVWKAKERTW